MGTAAPRGSGDPRRRHAAAHWSRLLLLVFVLAQPREQNLAAATTPADPTTDWATFAATERQAPRWRRTRYELERFQADCAWLAPAWSKLHAAHESLQSVIIVDPRHGMWPGVGDSQDRLWSLLRTARSLGRYAPPPHSVVLFALTANARTLRPSLSPPQSAPPAGPLLSGPTPAPTAAARRATPLRSSRCQRAASSTRLPSSRVMA